MKDQYKALGDFGTIGLEIALSILLGGYVGYRIDAHYATSPWFMFVGGGFGVAAAVRAVMRVTKQMQAVTKREEREQGNPSPVYDKPEDDVERPEKKREKAEQGDDRG